MLFRCIFVVVFLFCLTFELCEGKQREMEKIHGPLFVLYIYVHALYSYMSGEIFMLFFFSLFVKVAGNFFRKHSKNCETVTCFRQIFIFLINFTQLSS